VSLQDQFIEKLKLKYGDWVKVTSQFGTNTFGQIADDLCISASQFSKLISGTATEGMYIRAIKNIEQLTAFDKLKAENEKLQLSASEEGMDNKIPSILKILIPIFVLASMIVALLLTSLVFNKKSSSVPEGSSNLISEHSLGQYFDQDFQADFVSPYLQTDQVQEYCPCSAFEGKWELDKSYAIPLPGLKPGIYYVAKALDLRMKCHRSVGDEGFQLIGFEDMYHEIWVDKNREPLSPTYFDSNKKSFTDAFYNLAYDSNSDFVKIANIKSLMINEFVIDNGQIHRQGEPAGRYAYDVNEELKDKYEINVKELLEDVIANMLITKCGSAENLYCNPNDLKESESKINFKCDFTINTENMGFGGSYPYQKGYKLIEQNYSDNLLCRCIEPNN